MFYEIHDKQIFKLMAIMHLFKAAKTVSKRSTNVLGLPWSTLQN